MATTPKKRTTTAAKRPPKKPQPTGDAVDRKAVDEAMKRLNQSIEAAEKAGKDLRAGVTKGSRELVRDLEKTLKHARANATKIGKAVSKDLQGPASRRK